MTAPSPEDLRGYDLYAVVVLRGDTPLTLADLRGYEAARLAAFKCPEALYVVPELPRTATDKVSKKALRSQLVGAPAPVVQLY